MGSGEEENRHTLPAFPRYVYGTNQSRTRIMSLCSYVDRTK